MDIIKARVKNRIGTTASWLVDDPIILAGEVAYINDDPLHIRQRVGDGIKNFSQLTDNVVPISVGYTPTISASTLPVTDNVNNFYTLTGSGTYNGTVAPNGVNIWYKIGSAAWVIGQTVQIDLSLYLKKGTIALNEKGQYVPNLVDINSSAIMLNTTVNNVGDIAAFNDANLSYRIPVTEGAQYYLAGETDTYGRTIRYEDDNLNKVYYQTINTYPYLLTIPTGMGIKNLLFATKLSGLAQYPTSITLVVPAVTAQSLKEVQYLAGGVIDVNSTDIVLNQSLNTNGDAVSQSGANISYPIVVQTFTSYKVSSDVTDANVRAVQFQDSSNTKIGYVLVTGIPFTFVTPANTRFVIFNTKLGGVAQSNIFFNKDTGLNTLPWAGKKITLYGDSITNDYPIYRTLMLAKTGAATITQRGQSGQSLGQLLQTDSVLAPAIADASDLYIIHCVNDIRGNPDGTTDIPGSASSAVGASLDMAGGLKKIITSFISANNKARIVVLSSLTFGDVKLIGPGYPNSFGSDQVNLGGYYHIDYVKAQRDISDLYGCDFVDLGFKMGIRPSVENNASTRYLTRDGVHPSDAYGYPKMTDIISNYVNSMVV